jgi:hypothetical protein
MCDLKSWVSQAGAAPRAAALTMLLVSGCLDAAADAPALPPGHTTSDPELDSELDSELEEAIDCGGLRRIDLVLTSSTLNHDVFAAAGSPTDPVVVVLTIARNVIVGSSSPALPALTTGAFRQGSRLIIRNRGSILGAGGAGGSGGNGGSGGQPRACGRDGAAGGAAISLGMVTTLRNRGLIFGGGGGGGGVSGCNITAGGGGGAGSTGGSGGPGATVLNEADEIAFCGQDNGFREGPPGSSGSLFAAGVGGKSDFPIGDVDVRGGAGGGFGLPGEHSFECIQFGGGNGGPPGAAIERNGNPLTGVADGPFDSGTGPIRGAVR